MRRNLTLLTALGLRIHAQIRTRLSGAMATALSGHACGETCPRKAVGMAPKFAPNRALICARFLTVIAILQSACHEHSQGAASPTTPAASSERSPSPAAVAGDSWGTIKGTIFWAGDKIPEPRELKVDKDQNHCLAKGPIKDEDLVVNAKNKGVRWVFIWLAPLEEGKELPIHPSLKDIKEKQVAFDQPQCMYVPRAFAIREGQELVAKNSSPIVHNVKWTGHPDFNEGGNVIIQAGKEHVIKGLRAQKFPLQIECNIHPWMRSRVAVFTHPYFAITNEDGNFEIKNAPAGKFRLFIWQESIGWRGGAAGRNGMEINIKAGATTDLGKLDMKKD
jgi:hypothetical protein